MKLAIASGKGGTGKTTVAVNLALALGKVQLLDCDVEEPNSHLFLDARFEEPEDVMSIVPRMDLDKCDVCKECAKFCEYNALAIFSKKVMVFDELCHGCGGCGIVCPQDAISYVPRKLGVVRRAEIGDLELVQGLLEIAEPKATPVVEAVKERMADDVPVIVDVSPGAGCPVVESLQDVDYALLVTEPTPFGLHDLKIGVEVCRALGTDFGVVVNRDGIGDAGVYEYCEEEGIDVHLKIPNSIEIAKLYSRGVPFVTEMEEWEDRFRDLYSSLEKDVDASGGGGE